MARLEEFQPDTLAIKAGVVGLRKGWQPVNFNGKPQAIKLKLDTLSGLNAKGHKVQGHLNVTPASLAFKGFENYTFHDALPFKGMSVERKIGPVLTDDAGVAYLDLPQDVIGGRTANCQLLLEGFEADGGRAVSIPLNVIVSPLNKMLGWKTGGSATNLQYLPQGSDAFMDFITVDADLNRVDAAGLHFTIYARRYVTSLVSDSRGEYHYDEQPLDSKLSESVQNIGAGADLRWRLPTDEPGEYLLSVSDNANTLALIPFTVAGNKISDKELAPSSLRVQIDKDNYDPSETINLYLQLPFAGTGLITIERDKVESCAWFKANAGETTQKIVIPDGFEGRGFVNVMFIRSQNSPDIYREPVATAVVPFTANIKARNLGLSISVPDHVQPGESLSIGIKAADKCQVAVFAVDEGVLQLTRFVTPSPLRYLLEDRGLDTRTIHALNRLMPDHAHLRGRLPAFGGGMDRIGGRFHNPFRRVDEPPVATWTIIETDANGTEVAIPVPGYYTGKLRVMAVGASPVKAGCSSQQTTVSAPLMLTPRLPLTVTPGDEFTANLIAANGSDQPISAEIIIDAEKPFNLKQTVNVNIKAGEEVVIPMQMVAENLPGTAFVNFTATVDGKEYKRTSSMSIRPASHNRITQQGGKTTGNFVIEQDRKIYDYGASVTLTASAVPLPAMHALNRYLELYPYGCLEQLISRAFGVVLLQKNSAIQIKRKERDELLSTVISAMRNNEDYDGLALWPGAKSSLLLTAYGADLLLTMREENLGLPEPFLQSLCEKIESAVQNINPSLDDCRAAAYGIWLLTREGHVTTQLLERLQKALQESGENWQKDISGALFAASQRIMRMRQIIPFEEPAATGHAWFDDLGAQSLYSYILARYFPEKMYNALPADLAETVISSLHSGKYATFSASQAIRALSALFNGGPIKSGQAQLSCEKQDRTQSAAAMTSTGNLLKLEDAACARFKIDMPFGGQPVYWQLVTSGFDRRIPKKAISEGLMVERVFRNAAGEIVTEARQGEELTVSITAKSLGGSVKDCVILDLLPGGMEMILSKVDKRDDVHMDRRDDRMILFIDTEINF